MLTLVRSAAAACLMALSAGEALALQCVRPEMTGAVLLRWTSQAAFIIEGAHREVPGGQDCTFEAVVTKPVKGALVEGQTFSVTYNGWDGCYGGPNGKPTLGQFYRNKDGQFEIPLCAFNIDEGVVNAYVEQKQDLEAAARRSPNDLAAQIALARFYVGWQDAFRAGPTVTAALTLAPSNTEARLLKARLDLLTAGQNVDKLRSVREEFAPLRQEDPVARILFEEADRAARRHALHTLDGAPVNHVSLPPSTLKNIDLSGQDMTGFSLQGIIFQDLTAPSSDWTASLLSETNFAGVDFSEAIFTEAVLARSSFKGAQLNGAKFAGALLVSADFSGASMRLANLRGADATDATFVEADLRGADLRGAGLQGAKLTGAHYDCTTRFRPDFDPQKAGMVFDSICAGGNGPAK